MTKAAAIKPIANRFIVVNLPSEPNDYRGYGLVVVKHEPLVDRKSARRDEAYRSPS